MSGSKLEQQKGALTPLRKKVLALIEDGIIGIAEYLYNIHGITKIIVCIDLKTRKVLMKFIGESKLYNYELMSKLIGAGNQWILRDLRMATPLLAEFGDYHSFQLKGDHTRISIEAFY